MCEPSLFQPSASVTSDTVDTVVLKLRQIRSQPAFPRRSRIAGGRRAIAAEVGARPF